MPGVEAPPATGGTHPGGPLFLTFAEALACERRLLAELAQSRESHAKFLVWRTPTALIVPRGMPARANFDAAARDAAQRGWPVHERDTGGDLTPQAPGVINVSLAFKDESAKPSIAKAYLRLLQPVIAFLKEGMGFDAASASVEGSFCDGAYNLVYDGRKLGGTAQRWKMVQGPGEAPVAHVLSHIAIMADMPLDSAVETMNAFYRLSGIEKEIRLERHVSLASIVGAQQAEPAKVADQLAAYLSARRL